MEYLKSMISVIESNCDNLTTVERNIADFFTYNREEADFSVETVARRLSISRASLSRFAKKCEFRGCREFIYQYGEYFAVRQESITGNTRAVLNTYQELLNRAYNLANEKQVERIYRYMDETARMFVCGMGSSGLVAKGIELCFIRIDVDITSMNDRDMVRIRIVFQDEDSLVLGVSVSGETEDVIFLLQEARQKKIRTVLLTVKNKPEYDGFCDEVLLIPSLLHLNHGDVISP